MKIAVACLGLEVASYFELCDGFMCYTIDRCIVADSRNMPNLKFTTKQILDIFLDLNIDTLICGYIVDEAASLFSDAGIEVVKGFSGSPREALNAHIVNLFTVADDEWDDDWDDED